MTAEMPAKIRNRWLPLGVGGVFGFFLTASGLGDYRTIHRGLLLEDPYIYLMMAATVGTAMPLLWLLQRRRAGLELPHEAPERRHVLGGALFGVGFGVTATCPGITIAMAGTGGLYGLVVLGGILAGLVLRGRVERGAGSVAATPDSARAVRGNRVGAGRRSSGRPASTRSGSRRTAAC